MFADDYIGIVDARRFTNNLDRFLDEGVEGLLSLALAPDNAEAVRNCPRALSMRAPPWFTCRQR